MIIPHEEYTIKNKTITVYRPDLLVPREYTPYIKMLPAKELINDLHKKGFKTLGIYSNSYWVLGIARMCNEIGIQPVIYHSHKTWTNYLYEAHKLPVISINYLKPNFLPINISIAKKLLTERFSNPFFLPFGLEHPTIMNWIKNIELPSTNNLIIPVGSAVVLVSLLLNPNNKFKNIYAISAGRKLRSLSFIFKKYNINLNNINLIEPPKPQPIQKIWSMDDHFETKAYIWLFNNIEKLEGDISFFNSGGEYP